jgi:hypothetical protein
MRLFADVVGFQRGRTAVTLFFFSRMRAPRPLVLARKVAARRARPQA